MSALHDDTCLLVEQLAATVHEELAVLVRASHSRQESAMAVDLVLTASACLDLPYEVARAWAAVCMMLVDGLRLHAELQDSDSVEQRRYGMADVINAGDLMLVIPTAGLALLDRDESIKWRLWSMATAATTSWLRARSSGIDNQRKASWLSYQASCHARLGVEVMLPLEGTWLLAGRPLGATSLLSDLCLLKSMIDDLRDYRATGRASPSSIVAVEQGDTARVQERIHALGASVIATAQHRATPELATIVRRFAAILSLSAKMLEGAY